MADVDAVGEGELSSCQHKCGVFAAFYSAAPATADGAAASTAPATSDAGASAADVKSGCGGLPDSDAASAEATRSRTSSNPKVFLDSEAEALRFPVAGLVAMGLQQLQHRGQESCGIVTCDREGQFSSLKGMGLVASVCKERELQNMSGHMAVGHVRYSTAGGNGLLECQPFVAHHQHGQIALAHNGEVVNTQSLMEMILNHGVGMTSKSDSEVIMQMLCAPAPQPSSEHMHGPNWQCRIRAFMSKALTSYALAFMTSDELYAVRDPYGNRPLCIGRVPTPAGQCFVVSSESCAFSAINAEFVREIRPGEIVKIDHEGVHSLEIVPRARAPRKLSAATPKKKSLSRAASLEVADGAAPPAAFCIFEYVYFARQDSYIGGRMVHSIRRICGRRLFKESPVECDIISTVPESANPAAIGYAAAAGIPFEQVLNKNRYVGRSFIEPTTFLRQSAVARKFSPLTENIVGKRVVLVDDSIVRGNTMGPIVALLRKAGATEVHIRIASPPLKFPCYMGINIPDREELIANKMTIEEMTKHFGVDSLAYLSHEGLVASVGEGLHLEHKEDSGLCSACLTGEYPVELDW